MFRVYALGFGRLLCRHAKEEEGARGRRARDQADDQECVCVCVCVEPNA